MTDIAVRSSQIAAYIMRGEGPHCRTLLLRRIAAPLEGTWSHVAGTIGAGETAWRAALRKIREDTGMVPESLYSGDLCEQYYEPDQDCMFLVPVFVGFARDEARVEPGTEYGEFAWCSREEASKRLSFPAQRRILDWIWDEFVDRQPSSWLRIEIPPSGSY